MKKLTRPDPSNLPGLDHGNLTVSTSDPKLSRRYVCDPLAKGKTSNKLKNQEKWKNYKNKKNV